MAWIQNGPVSLPPQNAVYIVAGLVALTAVTGLGLGFRASLRENRPIGADQSSIVDDAVQARPIVTLPGPLHPPAPAANAAEADNGDGADDTNDIAAKTAAAQEVQARTSKTPVISPDQILTSPTEKPPPPSRPSQDESAPPSASDVPF